MKINVAEKYRNNIVKEFGNESFESSDSLTDKEKAMWIMTLWLLKDNYPQEIFDTEQEKEYLKGYLDIFVKGTSKIEFTFNEWIDYLVSK